MRMQNRIREFRAKKNITQGELAQIVGVRRETIVHLENNKYNPSLKLAFDIANYFEVKIEEIMWYESGD